MTKRMNWALRLTLAAIVAVALASCTQQAQPKQPNQFAFTNAVDAEPGAVVTSNTVAISGSTLPLDAKITGPNAVLLINGNPAPTNPKVKPGDEIAAQITASTTHGATVTATVTVGIVKASFSVTTRATGTTPTAFQFTAVTGAELNQVVTSNTVTLEGFDGALEANVTSGTLLLNGDPQATLPVDVEAGDQIAVRVTASDEYATPVATTVTVGTVSEGFTVTTKAAPIAPLITSFTSAVTDPDPGQAVALSWIISGDYDVLELSGYGIVGTVDVSGEITHTVTMPEDQPTAAFMLRAVNTELGEEDTAGPLTIDIPLWVCSDPFEAVAIPDAALLTALREHVPSIPDAGPITCADMQSIVTFNSNDSEVDPGAIQSLVGLQHAVNLENLILQSNEVSDLKPISRLPALRLINFDQNRVTDLGPIAGLTTLEEVGFWDNGPEIGQSIDGITDLSPLAGLVNIEILYLSNNNISDLSPLAGLTNLRVLFAMNNDISDLSPLSGMSNLQTLKLGYQAVDGSITSISALAGLTNLSWLELQFTRVSDLSILGTLEHLYAVDLQGMGLENDAIAALLANLDFPDATIDPGTLGGGAPPTPLLELTTNCIDTTDVGTTAGVNRLIGAGVNVEGYNPLDQSFCLPVTTSLSRDARNASFDAQLKAGKVR